MRGTVMMKLGAGEHPLAPTFGAFAEIEDVLDSSLQQIYGAHFVGGLKLRELAAIVAAGMNAAKEGSADVETVAEHLFDLHVTEQAVARPIAEFLLALAWSPEQAAKKLEAEWPVGDAEGEPETVAAL